MIALPERPKRKHETSSVQRPIMVALNRIPGVRVVPNVSGVFEGASGTKRRVGLGNGSPDLVGIMTFRSGVLGLPVAVAFGVEVKRPGKYPGPHQRAYHRAAKARGMEVFVARSVTEALAGLASLRADIAERLTNVSRDVDAVAS